MLSVVLIVSLYLSLNAYIPNRKLVHVNRVVLRALEAPSSSSTSKPVKSSTEEGQLASADTSDGSQYEDEMWEGYRDGFDWQLERARRALEGPSFAPLSMLLWQPSATRKPPGPFDSSKILLNNALQIFGLAESLDGAPLVQGLEGFNGNVAQLLNCVANGDLAQIAGGPLFLLLDDYYKKYGPVFKLAFGPKSFIVVSDPTMVKHILKENPHNYDKGILAEILEPIMGKGLIPADPTTWKVRRKAIVPGFHKAWLNAMMKLFVNCNDALVAKMTAAAHDGSILNMETEFCSVSLDIIGKAVFNFDFGSVSQESPVVKAVYRALQEAERRSMSFIPYWNLPFAKHYMGQLQEFEENMHLLNDVLNNLIKNALATQQKEDVEDLESRDYDKMENPSLLRFLVDMRGEDTTSKQLRDDLMTMLIAGHETTAGIDKSLQKSSFCYVLLNFIMAALLTWTLFELQRSPDVLARLRREIDDVLQGRDPTYEDVAKLPFLRLCLAETLRLYPQPPLLIRRALEDDVLPQGGAAGRTFIPRGTDVFIATWNMHRSPSFWENPDQYDPLRFTRNFSNPLQSEWEGFTVGGSKQSYPNEVNSDFAFIPFGAGVRKCVGDQFAIMESAATIALLIQRFDVEVIDFDVGMRTGVVNLLKMSKYLLSYSVYFRRCHHSHGKGTQCEGEAPTGPTTK